MRTINLTKIVTMLLITMLICSMMFEMTYANTLLVESRTVGNMELELEKHITKNKPEIEIGSEEYITYLCELLTFEDDEILAKNKYYEDIKIYASEYLSQINNPDAILTKRIDGNIITELNKEVKSKTIEKVELEAELADVRLKLEPVEKEPMYSVQAGYSDSAAISYAKKYGEKYNGEYKKHQKDCTNFVSQCVIAGGKSMKKPATIPEGLTKYTTYWYSHRRVVGNNEVHNVWDESTSFVTVEDSYTYWKGKGVVSSFYSNKDSLQNGVALGDVVQLKNGTGKWYHSIIITGGSKGARLYCGHTKNRTNYPVANISSEVSYRALKF